MKKQTVSPILYISYEKFVEHYNNKEVTLLVDKHDYDNTEVELLASKHQDEILEHISNNKLVQKAVIALLNSNNIEAKELYYEMWE